MANILTANLHICGTRALLIHRFGPDALPLEKQERTGVAGHDPEEWRKTVLMTKERQLYLEPSYIFACLRDAARHTKDGRGSIQPKLTATLQIEDDKVLLHREGSPLIVPDEPIPTDTELPVYMDIRGVRNPTSKARNVRYRVAASPGWELNCRIIWDKTLVSRHQMEAILIDAGRLVGLADGRSIGFGRFAVQSFEVSE
jgi:hypothetical protein